ncbi:hypothetical protein PT974_05500 [Cladobotryum mycophilum]|uniref:Uncharacterized protein n=1 Tax=Cladobotryum mycophilum TaxID=491253 RepID=A0ABR0SJR4_9HYPO
MVLSAGVTCGVVAQLILNGHSAFIQPGIYATFSKDMWDPIWGAVAAKGVAMVGKLLGTVFVE